MFWIQNVKKCILTEKIDGGSTKAKIKAHQNILNIHIKIFSISIKHNWTKVCKYFSGSTIIQNSNGVLEKVGVYYQRLSATLSPAAVYSKIVNVS
jgi:hypothetical protein